MTHDLGQTMNGLADLKELALLPACVAWWSVRAPRPRWMLFFGAQLLAAVLVEGIGRLMRAQGLHNHELYNAYMVVEFFCLLLGAVVVSGERKSDRPWVLATAAAFLLALCLEVCINGGVQVFATFTVLVAGILLAIWSYVPLVRFSTDPNRSMLRRPEFYALLSTACYFLCFLPVLGLYLYLVKRSPTLAGQVYAVNDVLFIVRYLLLTAGFALSAHAQRPAHA